MMTPGEALYVEFHRQYGIRKFKPWDKRTKTVQVKWERMAEAAIKASGNR